jgi:hypothetical protein
MFAQELSEGNVASGRPGHFHGRRNKNATKMSRRRPFPELFSLMWGGTRQKVWLYRPGWRPLDPPLNLSAPKALKVTIPIAPRPPMASHCVSADTGLQQKVPFGAFVLGFRRRTAPLPRRLLRTEPATRKYKQRQRCHADK